MVENSDSAGKLTTESKKELENLLKQKLTELKARIAQAKSHGDKIELAQIEQEAGAISGEASQYGFHELANAAQSVQATVQKATMSNTTEMPSFTGTNPEPVQTKDKELTEFKKVNNDHVTKLNAEIAITTKEHTETKAKAEEVAKSLNKDARDTYLGAQLEATEQAKAQAEHRQESAQSAEKYAAKLSSPEKQAEFRQQVVEKRAERAERREAAQDEPDGSLFSSLFDEPEPAKSSPSHTVKGPASASPQPDAKPQITSPQEKAEAIKTSVTDRAPVERSGQQVGNMSPPATPSKGAAQEVEKTGR